MIVIGERIVAVAQIPCCVGIVGVLSEDLGEQSRSFGKFFSAVEGDGLLTGRTICWIERPAVGGDEWNVGCI